MTSNRTDVSKQVGPSIGVSFATYEAAKDAIDQWQDNKAEEKMT